MCGGGGSSGPTESTVTQTNLPDYAEPFYRSLLARTGYESGLQYEPYQGQRLAYFNPAEQEAQRRFEQLGVSGTPDELLAAGNIAAQVGQGNPYAGSMLAATAGAQGPSTYTAGQSAFGFLPGAQGGTEAILAGLPAAYQAGSRQAGYQAGQFDPGYDAGQIGQDYTANELQSQYRGDLDTGPGFDPGTIADPETIDRYMSPYQQLVVDREKEEARRQSGIMEQQMGLQAAGSGSLGGYREAIMQAERERNLQDQMGDIQTAGSQQAFQQAQQAFEADRAARLQAGQFGLQTGQAQQQALQQAEQYRQSAFGTTEQARQQQQQMAIGSFEAGERARQQAAQFGMTAQQQEDAARQAMEQFQQQSFQQNQALQQAQASSGLDRFQAGIGSLQNAEQLRLQQFQANEAARQQSEQMAMQRARMGAELAQSGYGQLLAGDQQRLAAAGMMGDFVSQRQAMELERLRQMQASGQIERELMQRGLDIGYTDFLRQQAFPKEQLSFYSSMLQGVPIAPGQVSQSYGITPSTTQQLLGSGIAGVGLYNALGMGGR
jgi:hypothetical protein